MSRQNGVNSVMLLNAIRELWEQHIVWTRLFIISSISKLEDLDLVTERLLRNPKDFANIKYLLWKRKGQ